MQTLDRIFNPCTPFEKARERLLQLALRDVPTTCGEYGCLRLLVREAIQDAFGRRDKRQSFEYDDVLLVKLIIGCIDRSYLEECHGYLMSYALQCYGHENEKGLLELPRIKAFAGKNEHQHQLMQNALGVVALAWNILYNGTFVLKAKSDPSAPDSQRPGLT